jgi:hypothetical protein
MIECCHATWGRVHRIISKETVMFSKQNFTTLLLAVGLSTGAGMFLGSRSHVSAEEPKMTNADYARDAQANIKKAHEDIDHLVKTDADKKAPGFADANEAKKALDRADKAIGRYIDGAAAPATPAK